MRSLRDELEALQARHRELLESVASSEAAPPFTDVLERELRTLEQLLSKREAREDRRTARVPIGARVATFGFVLLFVVPIVAIIGAALGVELRGQTELAVVMVSVGLVVTVATIVRRFRHAAWHGVSRSWRLVREARALLEQQ